MIHHEKIRIISFPEIIETESFLDPSILLLGPVLGSTIDILTYAKTHIESMLSTEEFAHVEKVNLVTTRYLGDAFNEINEAEYNRWVSKMIVEHAKCDVGRVALVMIPKETGTVSSPVRGYARHTSFELGYLLGANARLAVYIEDGFCEYKYYYDTIMSIKPGFPIINDPLQVVQHALMLALKTPKVRKSTVKF